MDLRETESILRAVVDAAEIPEPPSFAAPVLTAIDARSRRMRRARTLAVVLATLLVAGISVVGAIPSVREAVLELVKLGEGVRVERVRTLPTPAQTDGFRPGRPTTLTEAMQHVDFPLLVPQALGRPDGVYVSTESAAGEVNFVYEPRRRLPKAPEIGFGALISQFSSDWNGREVVRKLVDSSTRVERLTFGGRPALWIEGRHFFMYQSGSVPEPLETLRLATNVLVVRRGRTYVRIESALSRPRVIEIARSLRPA